jgi:transcriptional regulator with GAF, ATPase, and Fis domain
MPAPATAYLVTRRDDGFGEVHPLQSGVRYTLGRAPSNRIVLKDDLCSREHAEIRFEDGRWIVRDLESLNGSRVNNERVDGDYPLESRDEVQLGRSRFVFVEDLADLPGVPSDTPAPTDEQLEIKKRLRSTRYIRVPQRGAPPGLPEGDTVHEGARKAELPVAVLYRMALDMGGARTLADLSDVVLDGLLEGVPSAQLAAITAVKDGKTQEVVGYRHRDPKARSYHKVSQFVSREVLSTREAVLADNVREDPKLRNRESLADLRATSLICAPVLFENEPLGLIHLYSSGAGHSLGEEDLEFTLAVARQLSVAWFQLRREERLAHSNRELLDSLRYESELVGSSPPLKEIESTIRRVAPTNATVLIRGESGSGKELVARAIHFSSPRSEGPFVTLNCAALTETLLESELFGHEKGAFTGATEKMIGKFEAADNGTIFLDEIGEMPPSTQAKFLRVLEGHPFERLGGNNQIRVDVRVVAATNKNLEDALRSGSFRRDLFFRLQVVDIPVPPLRDRLGDVSELAEHFLKRFARETGRRFKGFTPAALNKLQSYHWPGNVRELKNVVERAVALSIGPVLDAPDIILSSLDLGPSTAAEAFEPVSLEEIEKRHINKVLEHTAWNKSQAASILGIERSTLDRKIKAYELKKE